MLHHRLLPLNVLLFVLLLFLNTPAKTMSVAASGGLQLSWQGGGKTLLDARFENVHAAGNGAVTATIVLHTRYHIFYNLSLDRKGSVADSFFKKLAHAKAVSKTATAFIPLPGGVD